MSEQFDPETDPEFLRLLAEEEAFEAEAKRNAAADAEQQMHVKVSGSTLSERDVVDVIRRGELQRGYGPRLVPTRWQRLKKAWRG